MSKLVVAKELGCFYIPQNVRKESHRKSFEKSRGEGRELLQTLESEFQIKELLLGSRSSYQKWHPENFGIFPCVFQRARIARNRQVLESLMKEASKHKTENLEKKIVKLCLRSSYTVQNSLHFDEIFEGKSIFISLIFLIQES